ncbi:MAG: exo-alpha-sialidase [Methylococcaceae bacterium]|nr:exo-alpha-sialidase [Methylococcaceae bacterium]
MSVIGGFCNVATLGRNGQKIISPSSGYYPVYYKTSLGLLEIASFDVYVDNDSIHMLVAGATSAKDQRLSVRYLRSEDGGRHWLLPVDLGNSITPPIAARGNDIQIAASGDNVIAIWQTKGEIPGMGPIVSAYSPDGGKTWRQGSSPALNKEGDQSHMDLAADGQGNFHAVWLEDPEEHGYQSLRYSKSVDAGMHWRSSMELDSSTCSCCWNTLLISSVNELKVLYRDMKPRDMALIESSDAGKSWHHDSMVGDFFWKFDGCPHVGGGLAYGGASNASLLHSVVWTGSESKQGLYYLRSVDNGRSWGVPLRLGMNPVHGDIAAASNRVVAVWDEMESDGASIFSAQSNDGGLSWFPVERISQAGIMSTHPKVLSTRFGFLMIWTEKQSKQLSQLAYSLLE